jgi:hypothetical protein
MPIIRLSPWPEDGVLLRYVYAARYKSAYAAPVKPTTMPDALTGRCAVTVTTTASAKSAARSPGQSAASATACMSSCMARARLGRSPLTSS